MLHFYCKKLCKCLHMSCKFSNFAQHLKMKGFSHPAAASSNGSFLMIVSWNTWNTPEHYGTPPERKTNKI